MILPRRLLALPGRTWAESALLVLLIGIFLWRGFLPAWRSINTDFPNYYLAARLYRQGFSLDRLDDWIWFQRQKDHAGISQPLVGYAGLTAFSLLPILPVSWCPPLKAKHYWLVVNLVLLGLSGFLLKRMTRLEARQVAILIFLPLEPLRTNFLFGQEHVLLFFLLVLAAWLYLGRRPATSGVVLAVGAALKIYPALFLLYFLRKKEWRATSGLILGSLGAALLSLRLFGMETLRVYAQEVLPRSLRGETIDPYDITSNSFTALLRRLFVFEPELNPHPLAHVPTVYAVLQPLCQAALFVPFLWLMSSTRAQPEREKLEWGAYVALLLILSTNPASYHFCALILTGVLAADYLLRVGEAWCAAILTTLLAVIGLPFGHYSPTFPSGWEIFLSVPRLYVLTFLWAFLLWVLARSKLQFETSRPMSNAVASFVIIFLTLVVVGTWSNLEHLKDQFANYSSRLVVTTGSLIATAPASANDEVLYTTMISDGYATARLANGVETPVEVELDSFHPTLPFDSSRAWMELASLHSRIFRFSPTRLPPAIDSSTVELEDAEQPTVSLDGKWLAFLRTTQGRGSLWVKGLSPAGPPGFSEQQFVDASYDVRDCAFFPDNRIVFAAQRGAKSNLFVLDRASRVISRLSSPDRRLRYPAVSADGQWLAFTEEEGGAWHLWVRKLASGQERRLTSGDCNSFSPVWCSGSRAVIYGTDCGRGLGLTALCKILAVH